MHKSSIKFVTTIITISSTNKRLAVHKLHTIIANKDSYEGKRAEI